MRSELLIRIAAALTAFEKEADLPTFDAWVRSKKFKNPETGKQVSFRTLEKVDPEKAKAVRKKFNDQTSKWLSQDEAEGDLKKGLFESAKSWKKRVEQNAREVEQFRKDELDRAFKQEIQKALGSADPGKMSGEELDAKQDEIKNQLESAQYKANVEAFKKVFGDPNKSPTEALEESFDSIQKIDKLVKDIEKKVKSAKQDEEIAKLQKEGEALAKKLEDSEKQIKQRMQFVKENRKAVALLEAQAQLAKAAKSRPKIDMPAPPKEEKPEAKEEKPEKVSPKDRPNGDVWGEGGVYYGKDPKGNIGGPYSKKQEATDWASGKVLKEKAKAEKRKKKLKKKQRRKNRKKRSFEELVSILAADHVLLNVA